MRPGVPPAVRVETIRVEVVDTAATLLSIGLPIEVRTGGDANVQSAQPRDLGALMMLVGMLAVLLVVTLMLGRSSIA